jgi:CDP-diacylglycerol--serine O-phosphatidyltransferase
MSGKKAPTKGATVVEEKKKLLQQYKDDDGHFSLVR